MTSAGGVTSAAAAASEATFSPVDCCGDPTSTFPFGVIVTTSSVDAPINKLKFQLRLISVGWRNPGGVENLCYPMNLNHTCSVLSCPLKRAEL